MNIVILLIALSSAYDANLYYKIEKKDADGIFVLYRPYVLGQCVKEVQGSKMLNLVQGDNVFTVYTDSSCTTKKEDIVDNTNWQNGNDFKRVAYRTDAITSCPNGADMDGLYDTGNCYKEAVGDYRRGVVIEESGKGYYVIRKFKEASCTSTDFSNVDGTKFECDKCKDGQYTKCLDQLRPSEGATCFAILMVFALTLFF
ncbi:hypothetical protein EIN_206290 [Entamoeba invadens IP1]|uniref:Uncharacterized protein n=1 Tax=Entamoeba invadens IP1 TaxID=370355 RepID=A0A0A1U9E7_ENTIV|nr:hypothetical protein EIN_206290 [Entamoeba invadens IP1]ELP91642.1 hypothetical protein EIN_206290 [Entamoeba invadens IP1]|eukprot:XP_004258413.1 hypothetical protein EIN_206290 [Entamoeba invadens IP1]